MQKLELNDSYAESTSLDISELADDYTAMLEKYKLGFRKEKYYLEVGNALKTASWIIDLSVIRAEFVDLLKVLIPILAAEDVSFDIAKNYEAARLILDGNLGYTSIGKVVRIYPQTEAKALRLAKIILRATERFSGPLIPTDIKVGNIVYAFFGCKEQQTYSIPFVFPDGIAWPFAEITAPVVPEFRKLLNDKYKLVSVLKPDAKGRVIKGLYFKRFLQIRHCIIKEGRYKMWADEQGRDIRDRLLWQKEICDDLFGTVFLPEVYEIFNENDDAYLVMDFIKGSSLFDIISRLQDGNSWVTLSDKNRTKILRYLLDIVDIIDKLHSKGYIHRDITPANFMIDKRDRIYLIDLELSYSTIRQKPNKPFKLGTEGFMSPEQRRCATPTIKEDIYGFGATLIMSLTGLPPFKFNGFTSERLTESLYFFTGDQDLATLIATCLDENPGNRPGLNKIRNSLQGCLTAADNHRGGSSNEMKLPPISYDHTEKLIEAAINGLAAAPILSADNWWMSKVVQGDDRIGNEQLAQVLLPGWFTGSAGIMYALARAVKCGFAIDCCYPIYAKSMEFIRDTTLKAGDGLPVGLYNGFAGIAMALNAGIDNGLLLSDEDNVKLLNSAFKGTAQTIDLAMGVAGQGIALLQCDKYCNVEWRRSKLSEYAARIIDGQNRDGSWFTVSVSKNKVHDNALIIKQMSYITYFILLYLNEYPTEAMITACKQALRWSIANYRGIKDNIMNSLKGNYHSLNEDLYLLTVGISLALIKAYEIFGIKEYRAAAENCLDNFSPFHIRPDFTQAYGLAGLGEIYLEAYRVFNDEQWYDRSNWIAYIFAQTYLQSSDASIYWSLDERNNTTADFMLGNSGVIHFLLRHIHPEILGHPLDRYSR